MSQEPADPILQFFAFEHLPMRLQAISRHFYWLAHWLVSATPRNAERSVALRKLLEAKDAAVRASMFKDAAAPLPEHHDGDHHVDPITKHDLNAGVDRIVASIDGVEKTTESQLSGIAAAQGAQHAQLSAIIKQGTQIMSTLDNDTAAIEAQTTVVAGLATFVQGLKDQIAALPGLTAAQQRQIDQIFTDVTANNVSIANAMVANTGPTGPSGATGASGPSGPAPAAFTAR